MMRVFIATILSLALSPLAFAQGFEKVFSANGTDVWAVGNGGSVFRSPDGGATWLTYPSFGATMRGVHVVGANVWIVGDGGACHRSTNNGESFTLQSVGGGNTLRSISFVSANDGWIVGDAGTLLKTTNGGVSWSSPASPTANAIHAVRFSDALNGWLVGANGTTMKTNNGGASWTSTPTGLTRDLYSVDVSGSDVYVVGADASVAKSTNGGTSWSVLDFKFDTKSDVNDVFVAVGGSMFFCGGGGFIRRSVDGAASFSHLVHPMLGELNDIFFYDANKGWACSRKTNAVIRTTDGGATWSLPTGTTLTTTWTQRLSVTASVRGDAISLHPFNKNALFVALGAKVYVSYNRGDTWTFIRDLPATGTKVNSFYVSPKDSNLWVAAFGSPDKIIRSTNYGATWTTTITKDFSEYGMPLEMDGSHPDTLIFGPEDGKLWRSTNFGATWDSLSNPAFRSPCDIVVVRDNPSVIWVGDGVTGSGLGQVYRSTNGGQTFTLIFSTTGSEIPTIASSAIDNTIGYATAWGSGGVRKTADVGASWNSVATTGSAWGADIAKDDPNVAMYGVYGGGLSYLSTNGGATFTTASLTGANYALYCYDRATHIAQQSGGIFKMNISYTVPTAPVPIQLANFTGRVTGGNRVLLEWMTVSEVNNYGFTIQRRRENEQFVELPNSFVAGHGTTNEPQRYSFVDNTATGGVWHYRLKQIDLDGTEHFFEPIVVSILTSVSESRIPTTFFLSQNYPNPFNPATVIRYGLPQTSHVVLEVFDALGQSVAKLVDEVQEAGMREIVFDASKLSSGVYFYKMRAGEFAETKRVVLAK